jgi:hypothetical protein
MMKKNLCILLWRGKQKSGYETFTISTKLRIFSLVIRIELHNQNVKYTFMDTYRDHSDSCDIYDDSQSIYQRKNMEIRQFFCHTFNCAINLLLCNDIYTCFLHQSGSLSS